MFNNEVLKLSKMESAMLSTYG